MPDHLALIGRVVNNYSLSYMSLGLLVYFLAHPEPRQLTQKQLQALSPKDNLEEVLAALAALRQTEYAQYIPAIEGT